MDFEFHYTAEQQKFRKEVRTWLEGNTSLDVKRPIESKYMDQATWQWVMGFRQKLGAKGWLHPTYPKEYGGGGLSADLSVVIQEELRRYNLPIDKVYENTLDLPSLMVWGTDEQKREFLPPRLKGEKLGWQLFTEPSVGSDLASLKTRAVKEGDEWVITGEKVFVGGDAGYADPDTKIPDAWQMGELFTLAITDPNAPRHRNMGFFYIPGDTPGITPVTLNLLIGHGKRQVYLDNVRVPAKRLIGGETQGWQVAQTTLEIEHGGAGMMFPRDRTMNNLLDYTRKTGRGQDPHLLHVVIDAYIDTEIRRLFGQRNSWMYTTRQEMTYHGSQSSLWGKESALRVADAIREVVGLDALVDFNDAKTLYGGELEDHQRQSLAGAHPGGTIEVQKVIIARRLGVSRTKERAAPTPSTVNQ